ncbi:unnamed protein product [Spirodela intermedia]|uniref:Uncharacterized protein n=1 Tax=Spirodela intermedia TaxID=51605 RepID=A0A7I8INH7_SPIIN|nr:unnamed protein product [Spirodela intermedia]CAA6659426.1 unnamed protein product [Spirodela intermedia]
MGRRVVSGGCHSAERKNDDLAALQRLSPDGDELDVGGAREVATCLPADRPLPDDGLFVDQSKMIYSMDSRSFYRESPFSRVYDHSLPHSWLATGDVEGE